MLPKIPSEKMHVLSFTISLLERSSSSLPSEISQAAQLYHKKPRSTLFCDFVDQDVKINKSLGQQ